MDSPPKAADSNVDSPSAMAPPVNNWADEVAGAEQAKETPTEEQDNGKQVAGEEYGNLEDVKEAKPVIQKGFYGSRHADPSFELPTKDSATKTKWAAPAPSTFAKPQNTQKQPRNGQDNRGRGGFRGGRGGGYQQSAPKAAVPATTPYPGKTRIKEADWAKEYNRYLGNVKGFRNDPEMIDAMMAAWMGAIVIVLPDGREVLAIEYSSTSAK